MSHFSPKDVMKKQFFLLASAFLLAASAVAQSVPPTGYDQPYRPQYHFSPELHFMNDPNGLVYFKGLWHLYYDLGFIYYVDAKQYAKAAQAFSDGANFPDSHPAMRIMAAKMAEHAGDLQTARMMWSMTFQTSKDPMVQDNAAAHLRALQDQRVDYLEQPVKRSDLRGMAAIKRAATGVPLMADEACGSIHDAHALVAADAADVFCIKLYKHGGITPARKIAAIAEAANLKINCGGLAVFSQLEAAAGAHFYASRPTEHVMPAGEFIFGLGVIGPDPIVPETDFVVEDGHVQPPRGPGFGITVDERALDAHTLVKEIVQKAL